MSQPESWGEYPEPHYDEDGTCECPDHVAQREAREDDEPLASRLFRAALSRVGTPQSHFPPSATGGDDLL